MNIKPLECFIAVIQHGNLKDAASELGMTEAAVSKCLTGLSRDVGVPLFERHKKLQLTDAGQRYAEAAYKIIDIKKQTYEMILSSAYEDSRPFTLGLSPHMGANIFSQIYDSYHLKYPYVKINAVEGDFKGNMRLMLDGRLDMVMAVEDTAYTAGGNTHFLPITHSEWLIAIVETHPLASGGAVSGEGVLPSIALSTLKDVPFISMSDKTYSRTLQFALARQAGFDPLVVYTTSDIGLARNMARIMCGYCYLPRAWCIPNSGLRYFSARPSCIITSGMYIRNGFEINEALSYFIYLMAIKILSDEYLRPIDCPSAIIREYIDKYGKKQN